jgi:four helix bundle protein
MKDEPMKQDICERTFLFAIDVVRFCQQLEKQQMTERQLARQLFRSGTSVGANVEEAQGGHSKADFTAKMSIARKEARETHYWLRLCRETGIGSKESIETLLKEANELIAILTAIVKKAKGL